MGKVDGIMNAVILAAGLGTRMKSKRPKVVHEILGKPMVEYVIEAVKNAGVERIILVVGHKAEEVKSAIRSDVDFVLQQPQLGTGHAVMVAKESLPDEGEVLVLTGDTPLITSQTLDNMMKYHREKGYAATVITALVDDPTGYGRIIKDDGGDILKIVEHKDASADELGICEINAGMYCFDVRKLKEVLGSISNDNAQKEYYLTDAIALMREKGYRVGAFLADSHEVMGINDRVQLCEASAIMKDRVLRKHMLNGVTIVDPNNTYIGPDVKIGQDTVIYPDCVIEGEVEIGDDCYIAGSRLIDCKIGHRCNVLNSVIVSSQVKDNVNIGPFAYIRPESVIGNNVKIGDFVEIKKSVIGDRTKIPHLTYVGDAQIGSECNLGCGTIFVNYDGRVKHKTVVGDRVFIGCNSNLVAPVLIEDDSYIAAGSTITDNVPKKALAIARERQVIKEGWVDKKFSKQEDN